MALQHWKHWVEGGKITVVTDYESLKLLKTKSVQPPRIMRFLDAIEHYGIRIQFRPGKANLIADYLSRPPETDYIEPVYPVLRDDEEEGDQPIPPLDPAEKILYPHQLNRLDLQAIFEFLLHNSALPPAIDPFWCRKNFTTHDNKLY